MRKRLIVIPAHFHSKRLPGKVLLADAQGVTLLEKTYRQASLVPDSQVVVAAGGLEVLEFCVEKPLNSFQVAGDCCCGTVRVARAASGWLTPKGIDDFSIINWQADWPGISPETAEHIFAWLETSSSIVTAFSDLNPDEKSNPNVVKAVLSTTFHPHESGVANVLACTRNPLSEWHHQGIYGFRGQQLLQAAFLNEIYGIEHESLEQSTWLGRGMSMLGIFAKPAYGIDSQADWDRFNSSERGSCGQAP